MIKTIYLDMDGVLADWYHYMLKTRPSGEQYSVFEYNQLEGFRKYVEKLHEDPSFFENLPACPGCGSVLHEVSRIKRKYGVSVKMLSATGCVSTESHNLAVEAKAKFIKKIDEHSVIDEVLLVQKSSDKSVYASPDSLLIDDFHKNCSQWYEEGGRVILHRDAFHTIRDLDLIFSEVI